MKKIDTIESYIKSFPPEIAKKLRIFRKTIKTAAPKAVETISYHMPTFKQNGILVHFAAFKNHIGFYPIPTTIRAFSKELAKYKTSKGGIQFPHDQPLPLNLIRRIVKFRLKQDQEKNKNSAKLKTSSLLHNHIHYHRDGSIWAKGKMIDSVCHGYWQWFRKDGTKLRSGYFDHGKQIGTWITYDTSGKVYKITSIKKPK